jgi:predicted aminopeptidase
VFYGKATYVEAHRHRFSFQTVGFFDGRIHVVSAGHPAGELRALLFHEYAHAVFREQTGGDRPYWLNEGLAEISERASLNRRGLTRSERRALGRRIDAGEWLSLRRLAPSFSGLGDEDARAAYLQSLAAAAWIEARTDRAGRARMLQRIGEGESDDSAFQAVLGMNTVEIDAALQRVIREEFPTLESGIATLPGEGPADLFAP